MSTTQKTLVSLFIISISAAGFWHLFSVKQGKNVLPLPLSVEESTSSNTQTFQQQRPTKDQQDVEIAASVDEYGFAKTIDLSLYAHSEAKFLYKEGGVTYTIGIWETEGNMPIIQESSAGKIYTGLMIGFQDDLSPDNHRFVFAPYWQEKICMAQISPKVIKCMSPDASSKTFTKRVGDYDVAAVDGVWLDNTTFEFSVFEKASSTMVGTYDGKVVGKQKITF